MISNIGVHIHVNTREKEKKLGRIESWRKLVNNNPLSSENSNFNLVLDNELLTLKV
jgi:hypothetical protein